MGCCQADDTNKKRVRSVESVCVCVVFCTSRSPPQNNQRVTSDHDTYHIYINILQFCPALPIIEYCFILLQNSLRNNTTCPKHTHTPITNPSKVNIQQCLAVVKVEKDLEKEAQSDIVKSSEITSK